MPAKPTDNDRLLTALAAVDQIQREQAETNDLLNQDEQDRQNAVVIREMLELQGEKVDDETIKQALAVSRKPKSLVFTPMPQTFIRKLASAYIVRDRWLGKTLAGFTFLLFISGAGWAAHATVESRFQNSAQQAFADTNTLKSKVDAISHSIEPLSAYPVLEQEAKLSLVKAVSELGKADAILQGREPDNRDELKQVADYNATANSALQKATALANRGSSLNALRAQMESTDKRHTQASNWPELAASMASQRLMFDQAITQGDDAQAEKILRSYTAMSNAEQERDALVAAAKDVPAIGQTQANKLVVAGEAALLAGKADVARSARSQINDLKVQIAQEYRLEITNAPNEKSGVVRTPNNYQNTKNHYIIVDALDAANQPVVVSIRNEETGKVEKVSRFGMRVPSSFFEKVKADKKDNQFIDDADVGKKSAGELEPTITVPFEGGYITSW